MPACSANIITKDQPEPTIRAVSSLDTFLRPGDEIIIVDTGSSEENFEALKAGLPDFPDVTIKLIRRPDLSVELEPYVRKWLPEFVGKLETDPQYKDLRGILDFAAARNVALDESEKPLIFWIDTDDVLEEEQPGRLRSVVDRHMDPENPTYSALFLEYLYAFHEDGSLCTTLKRERVAFREWFRWKGLCHETLIPEREDIPQVGFCEDLRSVIRHTEARKAHQISDIRNYVIMRRELERDGTPVDPRTLLYIGNACRGLGRWKEAVNFYKAFDSQSGSPEDRHAACLYIASILMHADNRRPVEAADWYQKATDIKPRDPRGYFGQSRCFLARHRYQECLDYFEIGRGFPAPSASLHSFDPNSVYYHPYVIAAEAAIELGNFQAALQYIQVAAQFRPEDKFTQDLAEQIKRRAAGIQLAQAIEHVGRHVRGGGVNATRVLRPVLSELFAVPEQLEDVGLGRLEEPDPRPEAPRVAIVCGGTPEQWGPESVKTGIGGSEKMVILLSEALQNRGYNVTVYARVPFHQRGVYPSGVRWQHWSEFDPDQHLKALIGWRSHGHVTKNVSADKRILWLHDVQSPSCYTPLVKECVDYAIFESEYHAQPIRGVLADDKIVVLRNAIKVPELWTPTAAKDPKRVVFLSSPDRGATVALRMVAAAQKVDPEVNATILYGFSPYERKMRASFDHRTVPDIGRDASVDDYERFFGRLIDDTDARYLHRVGFDQVWDELAAAGTWLYPTRFPEISCMAAMEAQAAGVIPITSDFAALRETVLPEARELADQLGPAEDTDEYIARGAAAVLAAAQIPGEDLRRSALARRAQAAYDIGPLADEWVKLIEAGGES